MNILLDLISKGQRRELTPFWANLVGFLAVGLAIFEIWTILFGVMEYWVQGIVFLPIILSTLFIYYTPNKLSNRKKMQLIDILIIILLLSSSVYFLLQSGRIIRRWSLIDPLTTLDIFFGIILILIILESIRRMVGLPLLIVILVLIVYFFIGPLMPGGLYHDGGSVLHFIDKMVFTLGGIFGFPLRVAFSLIFLFVLFGDVMLKAGGSNVFMDLAKAVAGKSSGGMAKIAVVASGLFGMISGNAAADVVATGSFTIPAMKKQGYSSRFAGAVEVVASSGGNLMPPIMGAAAFIMVEVTGIPYRDIIIAAALPAILFYIGVFFTVHFRAKARGLQNAVMEDEKPLLKAIMDNLHFLIPIIVLIWTLLKGYTPGWCASAAIIVTVAVSWLRKATRITVTKLVYALIESARKMIIVTVATAGAGIVIGCLMHSGLSSKFTSLLLQFTFGMPFIVLMVTMIVSIILGMGMPSSGAYVLTAVLAVPAIVEVGFQTLQSNLFIFYASTLSAITPPVAIAAFAASAIAEEEPYAISLTAMRLGIIAFILPYIFMYQPALLMMGSPLEIANAFISCGIGVIALVAFFENWFIHRLLPWQRICLLITAACMLYPGIYTDLLAIIPIIFVIISQKKNKGNSINKNTEELPAHKF